MLTGGVDFNTTTLTATFDSGMTMSNVSVPVIVDNIVEEHEEFDLRLDVPSSLGSAITAGSRDIVTGDYRVTSFEDTAKTLRILKNLLKTGYFADIFWRN